MDMRTAVLQGFPASRCVVERWDCAALVHESNSDRLAWDVRFCSFALIRRAHRESKFISTEGFLDRAADNTLSSGSALER